MAFTLAFWGDHVCECMREHVKGSVLYFIVPSRQTGRMARPLRLQFAGALYHVTARGNASADIFLDDEDRRLFLELLGADIRSKAGGFTPTA